MCLDVDDRLIASMSTGIRLLLHTDTQYRGGPVTVDNCAGLRFRNCLGPFVSESTKILVFSKSTCAPRHDTRQWKSTLIKNININTPYSFV